MKKYVAAGRWFPSGSSMEENDVNSPSAESIIRQVLYGTQYFRREFGKTSAEYMLPDCFGFPASLPSILAHCGIKGFSTQKLSASWQPAAKVGGPDSPEKTPDGIPFNVGVWEGPDGQDHHRGAESRQLQRLGHVRPQQEPAAAAGRPRRRASAGGTAAGAHRLAGTHRNSTAQVTGLFTDYMYYGTGDTGGTPTEASVKLMEAIVTKSRSVIPPQQGQRGAQGGQPQARGTARARGPAVGDGPVKVVSATAEQMFLGDQAGADRAAAALQGRPRADQPLGRLDHLAGLHEALEPHERGAGRCRRAGVGRRRLAGRPAVPARSG